MTTPRSITRSLQDTISYKLRSGVGAGGVPTYGTLQTALGKYWSAEDVVRSGTGEEAVTKHLVHSYTEIPKGSLLWLPGENTADDEAGHIVDSVDRFNSLAVRGSQWTLYVMRIE